MVVLVLGVGVKDTDVIFSFTASPWEEQPWLVSGDGSRGYLPVGEAARHVKQARTDYNGVAACGTVAWIGLGVRDQGNVLMASPAWSPGSRRGRCRLSVECT